ncbi:MAG: hypothetical protein V1809_02365 [Planctomycetota bacterium]
MTLIVLAGHSCDQRFPERELQSLKIRQIKTALESYRNDNASYPDTLSKLIPKHISGISIPFRDDPSQIEYGPAIKGTGYYLGPGVIGGFSQVPDNLPRILNSCPYGHRDLEEKPPREGDPNYPRRKHITCPTCGFCFFTEIPDIRKSQWSRWSSIRESFQIPLSDIIFNFSTPLVTSHQGVRYCQSFDCNARLADEFMTFTTTLPPSELTTEIMQHLNRVNARSTTDIKLPGVAEGIW